MTNSYTDDSKTVPRVGLFVTCLVDLYRPSVGFAAVELLERAGCSVEVPAGQTCCGQPAFNSGDDDHARRLALQVLEAFEDYDYVVGPSGSCPGMIRCHYPELFAGDSAVLSRFEGLAEKSYELTGFLVDVMGFDSIDARYDGKATYHDSCSSQRELGVRAQPRQLLAGVSGLELAELEGSEVCCGFGGTFCIKFPEISGRMAADKVQAIVDTGADTLLAGDMGCLLNLAGRLRREGRPQRVFHVAEVLAGKTGGKSIGEGES